MALSRIYTAKLATANKSNDHSTLNRRRCNIDAMSRRLRVNYKPNPRKRKRNEDEGEMAEPPRPPMTGAERTRRYRARKKQKTLTEEEEEEEEDFVGDNCVLPAPTGAAIVNLEPIPGRSTDPGGFFPRPDPVEMLHGPRRVTSQTDSASVRGIESALDGTQSGSSQASVPNSQGIGTPATPSGSRRYQKADAAFRKKFSNNKLGAVCDVCKRIFWTNDLKPIPANGKVLVELGLLRSIVGYRTCSTCRKSLSAGKVPVLAEVNGFHYVDIPEDLPIMDAITELLVALRIPFMQIRKMWQGGYKIHGQIINVLNDVVETVKALPRNLDDDCSIHVCIKKHLMHKSSYLKGYVKKANVKAWMRYLINTPLYKNEGVVLNESFFDQEETEGTDGGEDTTELEVVENEAEFLTRMQETIMFNEESLHIAPGQNRTPLSIIFDENCEEKSFPGKFGGYPRKFREGVRVTPYHKATSEARRQDRRGAKPIHILYMATKIMRLRAHDGLRQTFLVKGTEGVTRGQISDSEFIDRLNAKNASWEVRLPNSNAYLRLRQKDLFAMVRQLGKPTAFLTMSANEPQWPELLKVLYEFSDEPTKIALTDPLEQLSALERAKLVSKDPVICCLYFHKLIDVIFQILKSKACSPFGKFYVKDYFLRVEFQHRGSPHVHAILWLANDPKEEVSEHMPRTLELINTITSINIEDLPAQTADKQVHKCTFTCTKRGEKRCRFNIPYWPMREQLVLLPLKADDSRRKELKKRSEEMQDVLDTMHFDTIEEYLEHCHCTYEFYLDVVRASLKMPTVFYKRSMNQLRTNPFNSWIADKLRSNMDLQFILDEKKLCHYLVAYATKSNRGYSGLHRELIIMHEQHPDADYGELMKKVTLKMLGAIEMPAQEAACVLLHEPMTKASRKVEYIPTSWPQDRTRSRKSYKRMNEEGIGDDSTDIWSKNCIEKYEERNGMDDVCLADFVAWYTKEKKSNAYRKRDRSRILRWRHFGMNELSEYKREMVLLFLPFRNELLDILDQNKFLELYDLHKESILAKRQEYDCGLNIEQIMEEYDRVLANMEENEQNNAANEKRDELVRTVIQPNNDDFDLLPTRNLRSVIKPRSNVMSKEAYCTMMQATNREQRALLLHTIHLMTCYEDHEPLQIFLTGPAGSGKTFVLRALMETLNRFSQQHNSRDNAYVACASTGKAASAINGTTLHHAYHLTMSRQTTRMTFETLQLYRNEMQHVMAHIIDEISMVGAHHLESVHVRLQDVYMNWEKAFGAIWLYLCGDLRQLFPVMARPVFKPPANSISGAVLWQSLKFHELTQVMRQADKAFSDMLTKIGNGEKLTPDETKLLESRFFTEDQLCQQETEGAIRLFHRNVDVTRYNEEALGALDGVICTADDTLVGYKSVEQQASARTKLHKMCITETSGLQYMIKLCPGKPYLITTNVDVEDGIVNGAIGELMFVEKCFDDAEERIVRIWIKFDSVQIGTIARKKAEPMVHTRPDILRADWTPIVKRSANIDLGNRIKCKRIQFPVVPACALTIHKSQGGTFDKIVFEYDKGQEQQMVYVALSRVKSLQGLFMTNSKKDFKFHHAKGCNSPKMKDLRNELKRLENHRLRTIVDEVSDVIENSGPDSTLMSINVQSLRAHQRDIDTDPVLSRVHLLALSETWLDDTASVELEGFTCIVQSKRAGMRAGGVAIYQNTTTPGTNLATPYALETVGADRSQEFSDAAKYGDVCAAKVMVMGTEVLLVSVYISPGTTTKQKEWFLARNLARTLVPYVEVEMPMVVTGDFNLDIAKQNCSEFTEFMSRRLNLNLSNNAKQTTTLGGTALDLTFTRNINAEVTRYIAYFSYHRPMLSVLRPAASE